MWVEGRVVTETGNKVKKMIELHRNLHNFFELFLLYHTFADIPVLDKVNNQLCPSETKEIEEG